MNIEKEMKIRKLESDIRMEVLLTKLELTRKRINIKNHPKNIYIYIYKYNETIFYNIITYEFSVNLI